MDYTYFKLIHMAAVVIFLGNIITGLFWMHIAVKTRDLRIINHTIHGVIVSDRWFTIPGVLLILAGGIVGAMYAKLPLLGTGWIFWSIVMFSISGIAFGAKVAPLQKKLYKITSTVEDAASFDWPAFLSVYRSWDLWGLAALLTPLAAFVMMVLKVPE